MALPRTHSFEWSDGTGGKDSRPEAAGLGQKGPLSLKDKELHMWVVYPNAKQAKKRGSRPRSHRKDRKLWAVMILEDLRQTGSFTYEVKLRRIFKQGERSITVWVRNDPKDPSDEANVFGFVSPDSRLLSPVEFSLSHLAAKRVYNAIVDTWAASASLADG